MHIKHGLTVCIHRLYIYIYRESHNTCTYSHKHTLVPHLPRGTRHSKKFLPVYQEILNNDNFINLCLGMKNLMPAILVAIFFIPHL